MKHLKLYEEYSDDEIESLMGNLTKVGQTPFKPVLGKDYGFTSELLPEHTYSDEPTNVYFTPETVEYMIRKGMAEKPNESFVKYETKKIYFTPSKNWNTTYGSHGPGNYLMNHQLYLTSFSYPRRELYSLVGMSGDYGFGTSLVKKVGKKARLHSQKQFLEKFKQFVEKEGAV
jgi:hypothetical protein